RSSRGTGHAERRKEDGAWRRANGSRGVWCCWTGATTARSRRGWASTGARGAAARGCTRSCSASPRSTPGAPAPPRGGGRSAGRASCGAANESTKDEGRSTKKDRDGGLSVFVLRPSYFVLSGGPLRRTQVAVGPQAAEPPRAAQAAVGAQADRQHLDDAE